MVISDNEHAVEFLVCVKIFSSNFNIYVFPFAATPHMTNQVAYTQRIAVFLWMETCFSGSTTLEFAEVSPQSYRADAEKAVTV